VVRGASGTKRVSFCNVLVNKHYLQWMEIIVSSCSACKKNKKIEETLSMRCQLVGLTVSIMFYLESLISGMANSKKLVSSWSDLEDPSVASYQFTCNCHWKKK